MMMSPIRIGVLGTGYFGTLHALTVNSLSEAQLCAVVDSSATALAKLPTSLVQIPRFSDLETAIRNTDVDHSELQHSCQSQPNWPDRLSSICNR